MCHHSVFSERARVLEAADEFESGERTVRYRPWNVREDLAVMIDRDAQIATYGKPEVTEAVQAWVQAHREAAKRMWDELVDEAETEVGREEIAEAARRRYRDATDEPLQALRDATRKDLRDERRRFFK